MILPVAVAMLFFFPLLMAYWFAPALVALDGVSAVTAMKLSFLGCLKNILPFLVYGLATTVLGLLAAIPFFLGLLVFVPVITASIYTGYRDIYFD
ncbi:MAG: BPSS1780 family membrane protein, partial [Candidatus Sedimenticola sp. 6PFRAG5]